MFKKDQRFTFADEVIMETLEDEGLLVDLNSENIFGTNETGTKIVDLISRNISLGDMLEILSQEYDISNDELENEINELLQTLLERKLIEKV